MTDAEKKQTLKDLRVAVRLGLTSKVKTFLEKLVESPVTQGLSELLQESFHLAVERNWREIAELFLNSGIKVDRKSFSIAMSKGTSRIVDLLLDYDPTVALQEDLFTAIERGEHGIFLSLCRVGIETSVTDEYSQLPVHKALKDDGQAGYQGRLAIIEDLVKLDPCLTATNSGGELPIHLAARLGLDEIVKVFLSRGSPVDASNNEGKRSTHLACFKDATKTLELLIAAGANINAKRNGIGGGSLHYASSYNARGCARVLIEAGADIEQLSSAQYTPLVLATFWKAWGTAEELIRAGANVNLMDEETHSTILSAASAAGEVNIVSLLLDQHPDLDLERPNLDGESPLFVATTNDHSEIVELLLRFGAKVDANRDGYAASTPLHRAIVNGSIDVVNLLLNYNANIESVNFASQTPFLLSAMNSQWKIAEKLFLKGAQLNVKDKATGCTPLIAAAADGQVDMVKLLLSKSVDVNEATTANNYTALMMAAWRGSLPTIKVLVENGADMNIQDSTSSCSTALIHATRRSSWNMDVYRHGLSHYQFPLAGDVQKNPGVEVIEYLLKHGANACDKEADSEESVLMMAVSNGDKAIVRALLTSGAAVDVQT
jgi:ankyrin repeat protein